jgi:hypothetical protein
MPATPQELMSLVSKMPETAVRQVVAIGAFNLTPDEDRTRPGGQCPYRLGGHAPAPARRAGRLQCPARHPLGSRRQCLGATDHHAEPGRGDARPHIALDTARPIVAIKTIAHDASPTHTHTRAKLVIAPAWARTPTAKLQTAYIPSGNTVDHRAGPIESRGHQCLGEQQHQEPQHRQHPEPYGNVFERGPQTSEDAERFRGEGDPGGREGADPECATGDPVVAAVNGDLVEVKAGDDEQIEPESERGQYERGDEQPTRVLRCRERGSEHGERFGGDREQQRHAHAR